MKRIECALRGRGGQSGIKDFWHLVLEIGEGELMYNLTSVQKDFMIMEIYDKKDSIRRFKNERQERGDNKEDYSSLG